MYFRQIPIGTMQNFSYVFGCEKTREAAVVDPAFEVEKIITNAASDGYEIRYIFTTHGHFDHVGGHRSMIKKTGAKVVVHTLEADMLIANNIPTDILVEHHDEIKVGKLTVRIIHTPGHTPGGICLLLEGEKLMTGDTLFVGDCGRTDLPGGNAKDLFESIHQKIKTLEENIEVYPGHHYGEDPVSTIGNEKRRNAAMLCKTLDEFKALP